MNARDAALPPLAGNESPFGRLPHIDAARVLAVLVDNLDGMVFRCGIDPGWTMFFVSEGCRRLTGYAPEELIGSAHVCWEELTDPLDRNRVRSEIMAALAAGTRYRCEYRIHCRDGNTRWVVERGRGVVDEWGRQVLEGFIEDVTEQVETLRRLAEAEARYRGLFENAIVGVFQTTADGRYLSANGTLARMYGYPSAAELIADLQDIGRRLYVDPARRREFERVMRERGHVSEFESEIHRRDGSTLWICENAQVVYGPDGALLYYQGTVEDISERKRYRERLEYQASHDLLTGLPNRHLLAECLQRAMARAERDGGCVALAFVDLDNFKVINDSLGHATGDRLLVTVAARLRASLRGVDTVARHGGDEFALVLYHPGPRAALDGVLERILAEVAQPVRLDGHELQVSCSIGVALAPADGKDLDTLLQNADAAMYAAKSAGRSAFAFYTPQLNSAAVERLHLEAALRRALERGEIEVHFQPKVDRDGRPVSVEALARWDSAELGAIPPAKFIPIAEDTGLIEPLTEHVLRTACREAAGWAGAGLPPIGVAVNLSPRLLRGAALVERVAAALAASGLPAHRLELEITEGSLMGTGAETLERLNALKALGVRLAVDDFGTGYSSLSYLRRLPLDVLKVDQSFVTGAVRGSDQAILARAIISIGRELGLTVVAEGVESKAQWRLLHEAGCHEFQGYLFSRPLSAGDFAGWLRERTGTGAGGRRSVTRSTVLPKKW
ncbi:EAL domain-containing protein [Pseudothauera rhizosphaerae]|uniref:EAL domain-containing protein n=1 Tax=Pseudothauera rhizosphaerae TaxID=2565932 RepID=A0A4S4ARX9_9RHOO|nr:EAL domain-containing protein [Pseudothauera rhizosphaerae]